MAMAVHWRVTNAFKNETYVYELRFFPSSIQILLLSKWNRVLITEQNGGFLGEMSEYDFHHNQ